MADKAIVITSRKPGFRRAGIAHPAKQTIYPAGRFTEGQLAALRNEPNLVVIEAGDDDPETDAQAMTVAQLTDALAAREIEIPKGSRKPELVALYLASLESDGE